MKKYLVEFAMAENFTAVDEWQTMDGMEVVEAETEKMLQNGRRVQMG